MVRLACLLCSHDPRRLLPQRTRVPAPTASFPEREGNEGDGDDFVYEVT